jgi:SAM-dependent methyltransferase
MEMLGADVILRPHVLSLLGALRHVEDKHRVSTVAEPGDLLRREFIDMYRRILDWQRIEATRVRVNAACCDESMRPVVERAYRRRTSHGGRRGASRRLRAEMIWETVWALSHVDLHAGLRIADLGTENSCVPTYLASLGCETYGFDLFLGYYGEFFRREVLRYCHDETLTLDVIADDDAVHHVRYRVADMTRLDVPDHSFDRVTCLSTIEHIPDDAAVAREIGRILKPGGVAVITTTFGPHYVQTSDMPHHKTPSGGWTGDLGRVYDGEQLERRIICPSNLAVVGRRDFSLAAGNRTRRRLIGHARDFVSVALFLAKR